MIVPEKPETDVWEEARNLLLRLEALTVEQGKSAGGEAQNLPHLLEERRKIRDRLDALRKDHRIAAWNEWPVPDRPTKAQLEVRTILSRLMVEHESIRHELEERMGSLKQKIAEVGRTRTAGSLYRKRHRSIKGAFIDARR
jgi:hypothetical protein